MAKLNKEDFISALKEMTILEVKELVAAAPTAGAVDEGPSTKTVVLKSAGGNKIAVIKIIKEITGLGLVEAKAVADNGGNIKENIPSDEAEAIKTQLTEAGAEVELV